MERFWVYLDNKVQGPVEIPGLRKLAGFNFLTQVCQEGQEVWRMADEVIEIKAYFAAPPRGSRLGEESQPELPAGKPQVEMSLPMAAVETLPVPGLIETLPEQPILAGNTVLQPNAEALRRSCATCGYKNPRDLGVCMKCGAPLQAAQAAGESSKISLNVLARPVEEKVVAPAAAVVPSADLPGPPGVPASAPAGTAPAPNQLDPGAAIGSLPAGQAGPMVEIPVKRIALILAGILLAGTVIFGIRHVWKSWRKGKASGRTVVIQSAPAPVSPGRSTSKTSAKGPSKKRSPSPARAAVVALPGVSEESRASDPVPVKAPLQTPRPVRPQPAAEEPTSSEPASYRVVGQAYPLKHRTSSPIDSKYAVKRRGEGGLWSHREEEAIQMAQTQRVYGGLRTIRRNTEVLLQILRDREYTTAFETGKRLYLFNDVDWAAVQKENPIYEVQLTLSGGREADGASRTPLRFAFQVDLERKTVEPGGSGMVKTNTMRAFYDESRIPPEERRSIAKDTEDLVKAAQPGASPLTLESVTQHYAATYSYPAMTRVADAFGLTLVNKKLTRATSSVSDLLPAGGKTPMPTNAQAMPAAASGSREKAAVLASRSGSIDYKMEKVSGKDRRVTVRVPSTAAPAKLWETLTSYDRLTQYVPDLLVSQRQGQDGSAIIVQTVFLSRLMFFVFKTNLHLRILENPKHHRLEFERLAGDFEKFSGYVEINPDPTGTRSSMNVNITLAPKGYVPQWALRGMAQNFLMPVLEAIRAKAESN